MINLSGKMRNSLTNFKKEKKSSPIIITSDSWGSSQSITDIHNNNNTAGTDDKDWESNYLTSPSLSTFSSSKSSHTRTTTNSSISFKSMEFGFGAFKFGGASTNSPSSKNTTHITNGSGESSYSGDSSSTSTYNPNTNGTVTGFENDTTQSKVANYDIFGKSLDIAKESDFGYETVDLLSPNNLSGSSVTSTYDLLKFVPLLVLKCVLFLSEYGLEEEGLYRISGSSVDVKKLRKKFENDPEEVQISTVTSLLKSYLRELPNELLPISHHGVLAYDKSKNVLNSLKNTGTLSTPTSPIAAAHSPSISECVNPQIDYQVLPVQLLQEQLRKLPYYEFALLQLVIRHLKMVVDRSNENKMTLSNLAVIFSPTLKINTAVLMALISRSDILWNGLAPQCQPPKLGFGGSSNVEPVDDDEYLAENEPVSPLGDYYRPGFFRRVDLDIGSSNSSTPTKQSETSVTFSDASNNDSVDSSPSILKDTSESTNSSTKTSNSSLFSNTEMIKAVGNSGYSPSRTSPTLLRSRDMVMEISSPISYEYNSPSISMHNHTTIGDGFYTDKKNDSNNLIGIGIGLNSADNNVDISTISAKRLSRVYHTSLEIPINSQSSSRYAKGSSVKSRRVFLHHSGSHSEHGELKSPQVAVVNN